MNTPTIRVVELQSAFTEIRAIRESVFLLEQGIDPVLEFDGLDDQATHLLAYWQGKPVGTVRLRVLSNEAPSAKISETAGSASVAIAKIERLAVLLSARKQGIGRQLMLAALEALTTQSVAEVFIHAQAHLQPFYASLGFVSVGEIFEEAGIPHVKMRRLLTQPIVT